MAEDFTGYNITQYYIDKLHYQKLLKKEEISQAQYRAQLSAASKRHVQYVMMHFIADVAKKENLDMTATLAREMFKIFLGRSIRDDLIVEFFATKNRNASSKTDDFDRLEYLKKTYFEKAKKVLRDAAQERRTLPTKTKEEQIEKTKENMF